MSMSLTVKQLDKLAQKVNFRLEKQGKRYILWGESKWETQELPNLDEVLGEIANKFTELVNKNMILTYSRPEFHRAFFRGEILTASSEVELCQQLLSDAIYLKDYSYETISGGKDWALVLWEKSKK